jgi:hypothetical protein
VRWPGRGLVGPTWWWGALACWTGRPCHEREGGARIPFWGGGPQELILGGPAAATHLVVVETAAGSLLVSGDGGTCTGKQWETSRAAEAKEIWSKETRNRSSPVSSSARKRAVEKLLLLCESWRRRVVPGSYRRGGGGVALKAACQRRAAKNIVGRATGETKERLIGGPGVLKIQFKFQI